MIIVLTSIYPAMLLFMLCRVLASRERGSIPLITTAKNGLRSCIHHTPRKMTNTLSLDLKSSALLIALVLVPIVVLFCAVAVALICSEHCTCRIPKPSWLSRLYCRGRQHRKRRVRSDLESGGTSARATESSEAPLQSESPLAGRETV